MFSLNIVLGFACSLGLDMGYNSIPHKENKEGSGHVDAHDKTHHHDHEPKKHQHNHADANHHDKDASKKDDCCTDDVLQFIQLDKSLTAPINMNLPALEAFFYTFFSTDISNTVPLPPQKYTARYLHPPPPDIRIAIQSFQI